MSTRNAVRNNLKCTTHSEKFHFSFYQHNDCVKYIFLQFTSTTTTTTTIATQYLADVDTCKSLDSLWQSLHDIHDFACQLGCPNITLAD